MSGHTTVRATERTERTGTRSIRRQVLTWVGHHLIATAVLVLAVVLRAFATLNVRVGQPEQVSGWWVVGMVQRWLATIQATTIAVPITLAAVVTGCTVALAWRALAVGRALGRKSVFYSHVAVTLAGVGAIWLVTMAAGVTTVWMIIAAAMAYGGAVSWNLHRTDALRADARSEDGEDSWGKVIGLARSRPGRPVRDDFTTRIPVALGPGETEEDVARALGKLEAGTGSIKGRARIERATGGRADTTTVVLMHTDAFQQWRPWPGLSAPGGSIADGERTAYYDDGTEQRTWFCAGTMPDGSLRAAGHRGRMGMTRSGKSGDQANEIAEVASRRDAVVIGSDSLKGPQGFGWAVRAGLLELYADTEAKARALFAGMNRLVRGRASRLAAAGYRDWTPEVYAATGMPAVVWALDEADSYIGTPAFTKLAKAALSTGVYLSPALPRADAESMPATARFSIAAWKCFGVGDSYSAAFALTDSTRAAMEGGPEMWRVSYPGAHVLDTQPGVDPSRYPIPCRSYRSDQRALAVEVVAARQGFQIPHLTREDIADLGEAYELCNPARAAFLAPHPAAPEQQEDDGMDSPNGATATATAPEVDDPDLPKMVPPAEVGDLKDVNPREPIQRGSAPNMTWAPAKPAAASATDAARELDRVIREMAEAGITRFTNKDLLDRSAVWSSTWVSRRLSEVAAGAVVFPPGLTIERIHPPEDGKRYRIVKA